VKGNLDAEIIGISLLREVLSKAFTGDQRRTEDTIERLRYIISHKERGTKDRTSNSNYNSNKKASTNDSERTRNTEQGPADKLEYVIGVVKKTVKQEDALIRLITYTGLSSVSNNPINLGIIGPTSEGKTWPVIRTLSYFPQDKIWNVGQMSTKVLVRQKGMLIDNTGQPIGQQVIDLKKKISCLGSGKQDKEKKADLKQKLVELLENSRTLIDLSDTILLFLEPPDRELWNLLKPILSHDKPEIEFPYVEKTQNEGFVTKKIVVRGWPACIFCSAKDESDWPGWPEIMSRFIITSPNMNQAKYLESNILIAQTQSLPRLIQEKVIISTRDEELSKQCISDLLREIRNFSRSAGRQYTDNDLRVWIPYGNILGEVLRSERGTDNRTNKRLMTLIKIIAISKSKLRHKLLYVQEEYVIANLDDLAEALYITQNISGIPAYKVKFFREIFLALYRSKNEPDISEDKSKKESIIAVTTKELSDYHKERTGRAISPENISKTFLNELLNHDYIGSVESVIDKRKNIYYPLVEPDYIIGDENHNSNDDSDHDEKIKNLKNLNRFHNFQQFSRLALPKNCRSVPKNWLIFEILSLAKYGIDLDNFRGCIGDELNNNNNLRLLDKNGNRLTVKQFITEYEKDTSLILYFRQAEFKTFYSKIFGYIINLGENWQESYNKLWNLDIFLKFRNFKSPSDQYQETSEEKTQKSNNKNSQERSVTIEQKIHEIEQKIKPLTNFGAWDLEWMREPDETGVKRITTASFVDDKGNKKVYHVQDQNFANSANPSKALTFAILDELSNYDVSIGHNICGVSDGKGRGVDSDLKILQNNSIANNIDSSKFELNYSHINRNNMTMSMPVVRINGRLHECIDTLKIFDSQAIKTALAGEEIEYRTNSLDDISKAVLGKTEGGKLEDLDGIEIQNLPIEKQKEYCLRDSELVMKLIQYKDGNQKIMKMLSMTSAVTGLSLIQTCHGTPMSWWKKILENTGRLSLSHIKKLPYTGGKVFEPVPGLYENVHVVDVASLYPTMAINYNISPETVNCECCRNDPQARVKQEVLQEINENLLKEKKIENPREYWICRHTKGIFSELQNEFRDIRLYYKKKKDKSKADALKILINSGYGVFGNEYFEYGDYRVADLIAGYGRYTLDKMKEIAESFGFKIIYGDTDSLFLKGDDESKLELFIMECHHTLKVDVELDKKFKRILFNGNRKEYCGITTEGKFSNPGNPLIKGAYAVKDNVPRLFENRYRQFIKELLTQGISNIENIVGEIILKTIQDLGNKKVDNYDDLLYITKLSKNPEDYKDDISAKTIGMQQNKRKGELIEYFKRNDGKPTTNPDEIGWQKYELDYSNLYRRDLHVIGYDMSKMEYFLAIKKHRSSGTNLLSDISKEHTLGTIDRLGHSDSFGFKNCKVPGDKFSSEAHACKISTSKNSNNLNILDLIKCKYTFQTDGNNNKYSVIPAGPAKGVLYITESSQDFISGQVRMRGRDVGRYPYNYLEMIDYIFGTEENTIEVCSGSIMGRNSSSSPSASFTVDINPSRNPDCVGDAQKLDGISSGIFNRWRGDPPYNDKTARKMYGTELPSPIRLLEAGARVCKPGSLMFLLFGNSYQPCPKGVKRIGCIAISVIPNNEVRFLNIYLKYENA
jgi:DNA polymerase elongation subunit (family B)